MPLVWCNWIANFPRSARFLYDSSFSGNWLFWLPLCQCFSFKNYRFAFTLFISIPSSRLLSASQEKKRKHTTAEEKDYEHVPRSTFSASGIKMKMMLPIKTSDGVVPQLIEEPAENGNTIPSPRVWNSMLLLGSWRAVVFLFLKS